MPTFGKTTSGAGSTGIGNIIKGTEFTCPESGIANSIGVFLLGDNVAHNIKCAIYKAIDNSLVGVTEQRNIAVPTGQVEYTFNFVSPPSLTNQNYILVVWADSTAVLVGYTWSGTITVRSHTLTYNAFPDPFADDFFVDGEAAIYCTYTAGAVGQPYISRVQRIHGMQTFGGN